MAIEIMQAGSFQVPEGRWTENGRAKEYREAIMSMYMGDAFKVEFTSLKHKATLQQTLHHVCKDKGFKVETRQVSCDHTGKGSFLVIRKDGRLRPSDTKLSVVA